MNFILKTAIATSVIFSFSGIASVDYSKCSEYLSPKSPFGGSTGTYQPFLLKPDGQITPHEDVISYNHDRTKNQEIIVYELPTYDFTSPQDNMQNPYKQKMRRITVIIQRDKNGQISEITNDQNISQAEIDKQVKFQRDLYLKNTSREIVKQHEEMNERNGMETVHLPFQRLAKQTTKFEIKNDQCVPVDSKNHFLVEPKADGSTYESKLFDINLCKDIDNFIEENPEAAACFKKDLNQKISSIFEKYSPPQPNMPGGGFPGMGYMGGSFGGMGGGGYGGFGGFGGFWGFGMMSRLDSHLLTNFGSLPGNEEQVDSFRKMTGSSPVITGHMILQECHSNGLTSFIDDEDIWKEQAAPSTPNNEGDSSSREI